MKVILLQDVKSVGRKGEIHEVSDAFARNVLIKKNQAKEATDRNLNDLKLQKANDAKVAAQVLAEAKELGKKLESATIHLQVKVGESGKVFGSLSTKEIAEAIHSQLGLEIDKKKVVLSSPIKEVGKNTIPIKLHKDVTAKLNIEVEGV